MDQDCIFVGVVSLHLAVELFHLGVQACLPLYGIEIVLKGLGRISSLPSAVGSVLVEMRVVIAKVLVRIQMGAATRRNQSV